jgi:hypothetical protein
MSFVRLIIIHLALTIFSHAASSGEQDGWSGFYRLSTAKQPDTQTSDPVASNICLRAILEAQSQYNIPDNLLLAIGIQEAGRRFEGNLTVWPWTANAKGKGKFFDSKDALEAWVRQTQTAGIKSVDVGCMQINQKWHARQFASLEEATDPVANVDYAARFLLRLYGESRDWWQAAGRYHSSTESYKRIYLSKLSQNQKLANVRSKSIATDIMEAKTAPMQASAPWYSPPVNWTSDMTGGNAVGTRNVMSIYSSLPLQAILPNFAKSD